MAAVNWFCLVLAFAFIKINVCIKVDPNGNYTTMSLNGQTMQPYAKSTIASNEAENFTLLGDTELSASERTRRLIPYMAFYVPVSELPINKQYVSKNNNMHATKQLARPSATGAGAGPTGAHIPIPPQYVHSGYQYSGPAPSAASVANGQQQNYQPNAGLHIYQPHGYGGQQSQQQQQQQHQQQYHLVSPPTTGHLAHLQLPGPPGPSALALPSLVGHGKLNGNGNSHNAFVAYKDLNPLRQKTVQYFPPLTSTASSASSSSSASASTFETIRQASSFAKQQHQQKLHHHHQHFGASGSTGSNSQNAAVVDAAGYRPSTKQSKINLTPFSPSNTVPGDFVPIVYTPVNNNNNNNININYNNNNLNAHNGKAEEDEELNADSSFNQDGQQYQKQKRPSHHHQQPQQIAVEYSARPLPPSASATALPFDGPQHHRHNQPQHQQQQHNPKQPSQFYSVTTAPGNADANGGVAIAAGDSMNLVHHQQQNADAISPPNIYHQNQHHHQQQQQQLQIQPEHVIIDASSLQTAHQQQPQTVTVIGSQHQQQLFHGGKSATHFQPPKPENFFEGEIHQQQQQKQQQEQQQHVDQVLKAVNSYSFKNSQMLTPQEKYVMYLQQRVSYNKHQQRHHNQHTTRQKNDNKNSNPSQIFILSSTMSPPQHGTITALTPVQPSQPSPQYDSNYPRHSPVHHDLYPRPELKPPAEDEEQILTIPVHSLFGELETLQQHQRHQQQHNHYSQIHTASPSSKHKSQYSKNRPPKPQYIDYLFDEPKQSLDDEHHQQHPKQHTELLRPTLGPPSHAFILVTTSAPFQPDPVNQANYGSSARPPYKTKPKLRLQPETVPDNTVHYATDKPHVVTITSSPKSPQYHEADEKPKYVYVKEEFGQKLSTVAGGGPLNKYESDDNQIPQQHHHQQHQSLYNDEPQQPLAPKHPPKVPPNQQNEVQAQAPSPHAPPKTISTDPNELPDIRTSSLAEILHKLQESNHLPHTLTPDNIDNSIKTLIRILNNLKQTQTIVANPPQHHELPAHAAHPSSPDYDYTTGSEEEQQQQQSHDLSALAPTAPNKHPGPSTGRPGIDYPNYADIPQTSFDCSQQRYKGFFGDPETNCQVWHYCDLNGGKASFLCPNGTIFSQIALTCDWWFNVKCATTTQLYVLNERLYKYILPFTPKFPEDYSGPIVDKYLAMKFQEMEEKMRLEKEKALKEEAEAATETGQPEDSVSEDSKEGNQLEETTTAANDANRHVKSSHSPAKNHKPESVNSQVSEQSSERNLLIDDEVNDISQRGTANNFESTTIATIPATENTDTMSFSLKPIVVVSSTMGPADYDDDHLQLHEKRSDEMPTAKDKETKKTEISEPSGDDKTNMVGLGAEKSVPASLPSDATSANGMQITVEKVDVIEIKPDGATGHLIRDMLMNSQQTN